MKLTFHLETNKLGSRSETTIEVDEEEWAELDDSERNKYALDIFLDEALFRLGEWGWEEDA